MSRSLLQKLRPYYIRKALRYLRHYGPKDFAVRVRERLTPDDVPYGPWLAEHSPDADALKAQRKEEFDGSVKFSVLVPVWNTPEIYFREMADSVLGQTYPHLELVKTEGSRATRMPALLPAQVILSVSSTMTTCWRQTPCMRRRKPCALWERAAASCR